jgi:IS30 family transposase
MGSKKHSKGTRGPAPLGGQRTEFMRLISIGVSNSEACRGVGVNGRTGTRWRLGRRVVLASGAVLGHAPVTTSRSSKTACARYLPVDERVLIGDGLRAGAPMTRIAADLGRSTSTITREVHRNSGESGAYRPFAAHSRAMGRLPRPRLRRLTTDGALRAVVQGWLDTRWSPEQISHSLRIEHPDIPAWHLAQESIYQGIYDRKCPLAPGISACLRTRRRCR